MTASPAADGSGHWEEVYRTRPTDQVSWFQARPAMSLELIEVLGVAPPTSVVDVGGGASGLVDHLVARGFRDLTVVDVSSTALDLARRRLGTGPPVTWVHSDVLRWEPGRRFGLWHDRAVFHFLTEEADRDRYLSTLARSVEPGGAVILATFAEDGPEYCSGLPVRRHSPGQLAEALGERFEVVASERELHRTPAGGTQPFTWVAARAAAAPAV